MDFELTDEQRRMVEMVRLFAEKEVAPRAAEIDRSDEWPRDLYRRLAELGLLGMTLPGAYGGSGADTLAWTLCQEELARASASVAHTQLLCTLMGDLLLEHGSDAQRERWLPAMARGEAVCVIAQTEPSGGSDVAGDSDDGEGDGGGVGAERHQAVHHGGDGV